MSLGWHWLMQKANKHKYAIRRNNKSLFGTRATNTENSAIREGTKTNPCLVLRVTPTNSPS